MQDLNPEWVNPSPPQDLNGHWVLISLSASRVFQSSCLPCGSCQRWGRSWVLPSRMSASFSWQEQCLLLEFPSWVFMVRSQWRCSGVSYQNLTQGGRAPGLNTSLGSQVSLLCYWSLHYIKEFSFGQVLSEEQAVWKGREKKCWLKARRWNLGQKSCLPPLCQGLSALSCSVHHKPFLLHSQMSGWGGRHPIWGQRHRRGGCRLVSRDNDDRARRSNKVSSFRDQIKKTGLLDQMPPSSKT